MSCKPYAVLTAWEQKHGRCWVEEIKTLAEAGHTWPDVAEKFGLSTHQLKGFCYRKGLSFPWLSNKSPLVQQRRITKGTGATLYFYRDQEWTLKELSALSSLKITTIYCRINLKGWSVKRAVETPLIPCHVAGSIGGKAKRTHAKHQSKPKTDRVTHASHRVHQ